MSKDKHYEELLALIKQQKVWEKGKLSHGLNPDLWRQDDFGNLIYRYSYGDRQSEFGWEEDHIVLKSHGGSDEVSNLRPLHWWPNARRQPGNCGDPLGPRSSGPGRWDY